MLEMIHKQLLEYNRELETLEKEIVRKYRAGLNCSIDVTKAVDIKEMQSECIFMMREESVRMNKEIN